MAVLVAAAACAPREAYKGPIADFAEAHDRLSKAVKIEVDNAATTARIVHVRKQVFSVVEQAGQPNIQLFSAMRFACVPLVAKKNAEFQRDFIAATANNLKQISAPPPEKFEDLVKQLGERYVVRPDLAFDATEAEGECVTLYRSPDKWMARYPRAEGAESIAAVVGAAKVLYSLISTFGQIALAEVDDIRRARALANFFNDEASVAQLKAGNAALRDMLKRRLAVDRAVAHTAYEAKHAELDKAVRALRAANDGKCGPWRGAGPGLNSTALPEDPRFRACFDALWASLEPKLEAALKAAADYDALLVAVEDKAFADLDKAIDKMKLLANGKIDNVDELIAFLSAAIRIIKAVEQIKQTAESDDTKAKIKQIKDALAKFH